MPTSRLLIVMILKVGQLDYVTTDLFWMEIAAHVKWSYFCLWYLGCLTDHHHNIVVICIILWSLFWKAVCYSWSWIHECASLACPTARKCLIKYPLWERSASLILNYVKSIIKDISPFWGDNCFRQFQSSSRVQLRCTNNAENSWLTPEPDRSTAGASRAHILSTMTRGWRSRPLMTRRTTTGSSLQESCLLTGRDCREIEAWFCLTRVSMPESSVRPVS